MEIIWKNVDLCDGYQVSDAGQVKSLKHKKEHILTQRQDKDGYVLVDLTTGGKQTTVRVHKLVAMAFPEICGEYFEGAEVNHLNEIKTDNRAVNLRWCTHNENCNYGNRNKKIFDYHERKRQELR